LLHFTNSTFPTYPCFPQAAIFIHKEKKYQKEKQRHGLLHLSSFKNFNNNGLRQGITDIRGLLTQTTTGVAIANGTWELRKKLKSEN